MKEYDVVIVGGGMVGSMLAAALASARSTLPALRIAVLEN
ncbi:MAG: 2-polyprenyl-6-methoxyphenol hydroxylase-like FAD-dependent oxidoreductase, partial [Flavobacteriaceae bacterium]